MDEAGWLTGFASDPDRVRRFWNEHGNEDETRNVVELVKKHFPLGSGIDIRVDDDPEESGEWLVIDVSNSSDPVDEVLHCYDAFLTDWLATAPPTADKLIRVTLNLS
jgi:hypothetical protein